MCNGENLNKKSEILKTAQTPKKCAMISCTKENQMCKWSKKMKESHVYHPKKVFKFLFL